MTAAIALAAAVVWGGSDFVAGLLGRRVAPLVIVVWSQVVAAIVTTALVLLTGRELPTGPWAGWGAAAGVSGGAGLVLLYAGLATGRMGVVAPIASLGALVPVVLGVLGGEPVTPVLLVGMVLAIGGATVVGMGEEPATTGAPAAPVAGTRAIPPQLYGVGAALGLGGGLYCLDAGGRVSTLHALWSMKLASLVLVALVLLVRRSSWRVPARALPGLLLVGIADLTAVALFALAASRGEVSIVSVLASMYPVTTVVLAVVILKERLRRMQLLGALAALGGVGILSA